MTPADVAQRIAALDWSGVPVEHQLAVSAALETLKGLEPMQPDPIVTFAPEVSNVITLPVKPRTCWTTLCHLDGREWARASHFGPQGAWSWIVEAVAAEHGVAEDSVGNLEGTENQYDGDDLVTVDGLPVYRIQHLSV